VVPAKAPGLVIVFGALSQSLAEALGLYVSRAEAEQVVKNWDRDEPDRIGELTVEKIELGDPMSLS
jgi:hypothetical protein